MADLVKGRIYFRKIPVWVAGICAIICRGLDVASGASAVLGDGYLMLGILIVRVMIQQFIELSIKRPQHEKEPI